MSNYATSLSPQKFFFLLDTLRRANLRYGYVANQLCQYYGQQRTHSARIRAWELGLTINTDKAKRCPQKAVSVVPLPIIEVDTPAIAVLRPIPVYQPGRWNVVTADGTHIQVPCAPLMTCVSLPLTASDMDLDSSDAAQSTFSSDQDEDSDADSDMSISPSPSSSPSLFLGSSPTQVGSGSSLPTPPDSGRRPIKYRSSPVQSKIKWRITRSPTLSIHSYIDGRLYQV